MGHLRNRGTKQKPKWSMRWIDLDGKEHERLSKQPTKEGAARGLAEIEARVARGLMGISEPTRAEREARTLTVAELCARFLGDVEGCAGYVSPKIKSLKNYRRDARTVFKARVLPAWGNRAASSITRTDAEALRDALSARNLAGASIVQTLAVLSKMYNWAHKMGILDGANPVKGVDRPRAAQTEDYLEKAEVQRLLACVQGLAAMKNADHEARVRATMVATGIYTGLRKGELFGLRWRDVNLDAKRITVARSYGRLPKGGEVRYVPIADELLPILERWRDACPETAGGLVFPVEPSPGRLRMGVDLDGLGLLACLEGASCHAPLDGHPWHLLRHTFASHAVMSGASLYQVQRLLGHKMAAMTQRYAHLAPDYLAGAVAGLTFAPGAEAGVVSLAEERRKRDRGE